MGDTWKQIKDFLLKISGNMKQHQCKEKYDILV